MLNAAASVQQTRNVENKGTRQLFLLSFGEFRFSERVLNMLAETGKETSGIRVVFVVIDYGRHKVKIFSAERQR